MIPIAIILADTISQLVSTEGVNTIAQMFNSKNILETPVTLGTKKVDKTLLASKTLTSNIIDNKKVEQSIVASVVSLNKIYVDHRQRVNWAFFVSISCSILAVLLLLWIILSGSRTDISIKLIFPLLSSFLSGTLFWIYKTEQAKMEAVEKDIRSLDVLKTKINLLAITNNSEQVVKLLKAL